MTCTSTSASTTHAFDPSAWLARFETEARTRTFADRRKLFDALLAGVAERDRPALYEYLRTEVAGFLRRRRDGLEG